MNELELRQQRNLDQAGRFLGRFATLLLITTTAIFLGPVVLAIALLAGVLTALSRSKAFATQGVQE
jgi:hypothetical protein